MNLISLITSLGSAIIVLVFVLLFVVLTGRWSRKRLKEISGRMDNELDQLTSKKRELKRIDREILSLRNKKMELMRSNDVQSARNIENEIGMLQRKKDRIHKFIEDNY
ncbi:MAG: hypothetical protein COY38_03795 [Candidatus Aenigmarchaeota archaeon CG_4_10_14_0_8_um_filter_37_24]|nr:hypothetical protein [Candidatus Aenigmarchaeota archaeon]OIN88227.1 MAG: hypothetical protein AUJ50_01525 [Candidatus Aenigmarchaeota archaeon CG1_02_38_14]PIV69341.1 MAG: hypothetical protein COS07_01125 [Candidatus Aenigmarchaeota archaeon CG01_land_8_20_14_3_00_37_9]PIW41183.1 MAG: hypothetical protein COW21_03330 [Candidatus Aenigmarchaeota archaeon CG15_BIG_FIL_POST_REV_8_21_14_020_37_27]PIX50813.1 MAG: hypothetical protein COZ52_02255 [Candidatus Aenigmarchaeota archaeon CG_4_8_14_3_u